MSLYEYLILHPQIQIFRKKWEDVFLAMNGESTDINKTYEYWNFCLNTSIKTIYSGNKDIIFCMLHRKTNVFKEVFKISDLIRALQQNDMCELAGIKLSFCFFVSFHFACGHFPKSCILLDKFI